MANFSLYQQVLENLPDGITIQDKDFNIIYQNAAMIQAFGNKVGAKCYASYEKREKICEACGVDKAFQTGKPNMVHRTAVLENGGKAHWENACFPLFDEANNIIAGVEVCRDVTDRAMLAEEVRERSVELGILNDRLVRKQNELEEKAEELLRAYHELQMTHTRLLQQEKMASIGQLAAGIAHEMNTPIQYVGDNIAFVRRTLEELLSIMRDLQDKLASNEVDSVELLNIKCQFMSLFQECDFDYLKTEAPLALDEAADGVRRVAKIVMAMKNFARSEDSPLGAVELDDLIKSAVEITRNAWKNIADVDLDLVDPPLVVMGQWSELGQVLLNLISNAVDAIADKPRREGERGHIRIITRRKDGMGEILVEDTGCGIEPSVQKKIFEPFFTTKKVGRGSGQGLTIAYSIIAETHGGELLVESEPGKGSTFIVRLSLYD
ncbi:MAG: ATP-binding protein [Rhodospirillaceae bacterium]